MDNVTLMPLVKRWWWVLAASGLVAAVAAFGLAQQISPTYEAAVRVLVGPLNAEEETLEASGKLSRTYADLAASRPVVAAAIEASGVRTTPEELIKDKAISASSNEITRILDVRVGRSDPREAARLANAIAARLKRLASADPPEEGESVEEFLRQDELEKFPPRTQEALADAARRTLGSSVAGRIDVIEPAEPPPDAAAPATTLMALLAGLAGLLIAGVVVLVRESSADSVEGEADLAELGKAAVLGAIDIPRSSASARALPVESGPDSPAAERYRVLAAKAGFLDGERPVKSVLILDSGDGTSSAIVAANLAAVLAEADRRVVLVDTSAGEGGVSALLDLDERPGYGELLAGGAGMELNGKLDQLMVKRSDELIVLPRGQSAPAGLLDVDRARRLLGRLSSSADLVVLGAPPIDRSPTALVWARVAEATVLVVDDGRTSREGLTQIQNSLELVGARVVGTVLGRDTRPRVNLSTLAGRAEA